MSNTDAPPPSAPAADEDAVDAIEVTEAELRRIWADEAGREPDAFDVEAAFDALASNTVSGKLALVIDSALS